MGAGKCFGALMILGLWPCLQLAASAGALSAAEKPRCFHEDGISLSVPETWIREARPGPGEPAGLAGTEASVVAAWSLTRGGRTVAGLTLAASPRRTEASAAACPIVRRAVERALRASAGESDVRILAFERAELGGLDAYRAEAARRGPSAATRQLLYVVAAERTFFLTFSALEEDFDSSMGEFESIASSARVDRAPGPLRTMPPWLCGSALGLFVGLAAAARRGRKSLLPPRSRMT